MKITKLKYQKEFNFILYGITTSDNDYQLSWKISNYLNYEFVKVEDIAIEAGLSSSKHFFSVYKSFDLQHFSENDFCIMKIIANKSDNCIFVEEHRNIDFFILLFEIDNESLSKKILSCKSNINSINAVFQIDISKIKFIDKLLY